MKTVVKVGLGSCGMAAGGNNVYTAIAHQIQSEHLPVTLKKTGCEGMCYREVLVDITSSDTGRVVYSNITVDKVTRLVTDHIINNQPITDWILYQEKPPLKADNYLDKQQRIVLRNCGKIDPENINDYFKVSGYKALKKVLTLITPEQIIAQIKNSGLRGRGGAGFPTGLKWEFCRQSAIQQAVNSEQRAVSTKQLITQSPNNTFAYVICNADEGDPGAFMDRSVLESDPHSVIEGMIIAGYAIGSSQGYIYVRAEYPLAIDRLDRALRQARNKNVLGKNILGTTLNFEIELKQGAGAFVCGEETALIASLEGRRGMPRVRPPFPANAGLWGKPTCINNVETLANIPWIIINGADKFAAYGTEKSKGTKVFALAGQINRTGLVEVPMGLPLRELIFNIAGGIRDGRKFKAVQMGGPSGGCIPESLLDTPIDYESITATGAIMGSGGMVVMDDTSCMVDIARFFLHFVQDESCGKCTFCRIGTRRMLELLNNISEGKAVETDLDKLENLARQVKITSLCGLGQTAPNPVLTTIKYFRDEYISHIRDKKCTAKKCRSLITYSVISDKCTGCTLCIKVCPTEAVTGVPKKIHTIDPVKCSRCGKCYDVCRFKAILVD